MDEEIIGKIVREAFEKGKREHASHTRFALATHIGDRSGLSSKTLERVYDSYISRKKRYGRPQAESIEFLCRYLGYANYQDYWAQYQSRRNSVPKGKKSGGRSGMLQSSFQFLGGAILLGALGSILLNGRTLPEGTYASTSHTDCKSFSDTLYVVLAKEISPDYIAGTDWVSLVNKKTSKKVAIDTAHIALQEKQNELIFFYRNRNGEIGYFNNHPLQAVADKAVGAFGGACTLKTPNNRSDFVFQDFAQ